MQTNPFIMRIYKNIMHTLAFRDKFKRLNNDNYYYLCE